jgi:hypothetical protein
MHLSHTEEDFDTYGIVLALIVALRPTKNNIQNLPTIKNNRFEIAYK